jgi:hypothetical protein
MNIHSTVGALALSCISIGCFILLLALADYLERRERKKRWEQNKPTKFDIEN